MTKRRWSLWLGGILLPALILSPLGGAPKAVPNGGYAHPEVLLQPEELKVLIDRKDPGIRIIDVRQKDKYGSGHIPGAVHAWRPDMVDKNHRLPGMMAPRSGMEELMGSLGISANDTIAIYSDGPDNARLWWILAYYGFPLTRLKILDGGIDGWIAKGYPTETASPPVEKKTFKFPEKAIKRTGLLCSLTDVKSALNHPKSVVLDVRSKKEYSGEETMAGAARPGRIPGVIWIEWKEALVKDGPLKGYWKSSEEIKKIFAAKGATPDKDIHMY
jgi:thiosulfate/3-mercaptopyruvate sulfurtransferase